jgi:hypothetical protein
LEGCLEWTLKFQEEAEQTRLGLIISQSGVKELQLLLLLLGTEVLEKLLIFFDSNATDILTGTTETDLEDGQEATKLLYLKVSLIMDQVLATIGNRNFGNYWFYLGPAEILLWFMVEKNINTLAAVLSANPPADLPLRLQVGAPLYRKSCCYVSIRSCLYRSSTV